MVSTRTFMIIIGVMSGVTAVISISLAIAALSISLGHSKNFQQNSDIPSAFTTTSASSISNSTLNSSFTTYQFTGITPPSGLTDSTKYLIDSLNQSVNPCVSPFHFACDGWIHKHGRPEDYSITALIRENVRSEIEGVLDGIDSSDNSQPMFLRKTVAAYDLCLQSHDVNNTGLLNVLNSLNGWPAINSNWSANCGSIPCNQFNIGTTVGKLQSEHGVDSLFSLTVVPDWKTPTKYAINVAQTKLYLGNRDIYLDTKFVSNIDKYVEGIVNVIVTLGNAAGVNVEPQNALSDATSIVEFEKQIAELVIPAGSNRNPVPKYNPMTKSQITSKWPELKFDSLLISLFPGQIWQNSDIFIIHQPHFLDELQKLVIKTETRTMQNYLVWRYIGARQFLINLLKPRGLPLPKIECSSIILETFPLVTGRIYMDLHPLDAHVITEINTMLDNIFRAFQDRFDSLSWLSMNSKKNVLAKLDDIVRNIGYPSIVMENDKLNDLLGPLDLKQLMNFNNPITAFEAIAAFKQSNWLGRLDQPVDRNDFGLNKGPAEVNTWYDPYLNSITVPRTLLSPPYFRMDYPKAYNYGWLGTILAQEMGHAYDDEGIQFSSGGILNPCMEPQSMLQYTQEMRCIANQYSNFCPVTLNGTPVCVDGNSTLGENLADSIALRTSFDAYKIYMTMSGNGAEILLPGLSLTMEQTFFASFMQEYCSFWSDKSLSTQLLDQQSPNIVRVHGMIVNTHYFANAFKCIQGQPMDPGSNSVCTVF